VTSSDKQMNRLAVGRLRGALSLWGPPIIYMGVIFALSSMPKPIPALVRLLPSDKVGHFIEYSLLGLLLGRALGTRTVAGQVAGTLGLGGLYGLSDEWHQSFVPGRTADVIDWCVDLLGLLLGMLLWTLCIALRKLTHQGKDNLH